MPQITRLIVNKRQITETRIVSEPSEPLADGQALFHIERFAFTANNISYAATGDLLQYWQFFPVDAQWGCVPTWGFASVLETRSAAVEVGERLWGFWPMASHVVMTPIRATAHGFSDGAAHRKVLPSVYNEYLRTAQDPVHTDGQEDVEALLRPLFSTGWLVDDFLADNDFFGAKVVLLSSASSKTAYGTAAQLARRDGIEVIGLTAPHNVAFVQGLGCYDKVVAYDALDQLDTQAATVYLDYAGDAELRRKVHGLLPELRHSSSIGASHVDKVGSSSGLPGPKPAFLFVPNQAAKRVKEWGVDGLMSRMANDWHSFADRAVDPARPWVLVAHHAGAEAVQAAYALVLAGKSPPSLGRMLSL
jgi:hypothetical protein